MASRWLAFLVWGVVAATAVGWLLRLGADPRSAPAHTLAVDMSASVRSDLTRLFGAAPAAPVADAPTVRDTRYKLVGVVAPRSAVDRSEGLALIAVDGKPARAYRVGAAVDGETLLLAVRARSAELGARGAPPSVTLDLAPLPAAATGTLPGTVGVGPAAANPSALPSALAPQPPAALPPAQPVLSPAEAVPSPAQPSGGLPQS